MRVGEECRKVTLARKLYRKELFRARRIIEGLARDAQRFDVPPFY